MQGMYICMYLCWHSFHASPVSLPSLAASNMEHGWATSTSLHVFGKPFASPSVCNSCMESYLVHAGKCMYYSCKFVCLWDRPYIHHYRVHDALVLTGVGL